MDSVRRYIRQNIEVVGVGLLGLIFVAIGLGFALCSGQSITSTILIGVGSSLLAAALATLFSPVSREIYQKVIGLGIAEIWPSRDEVPKKEWTIWLRRARQQCILLGIAHNNWCRDADFEDALFDRLRKGVEVKVLFLDPSGTAVKIRGPEDTGRNTDETIRKSIKVMLDIKGKLDEASAKRFRLYVYEQTPSCGATWVDSFIVVTHYLPGFANLTSPAWLLKPVQTGSGLDDMYAIYTENVRKIQQHATEITESNFEKYI